VSGVYSSQHETRRRVDRTHRKLPQNRMGHSPTSSQHSGAAVQILHMRASLDRHSLTLLQAVVYGPAAGTSVRLGMIVYLLRCQCFCSSPESTPGDQRRRRLGLRRDSVSARLCFGVLWWSASAWAEMQYLLRRRGAEHGVSTLLPPLARGNGKRPGGGRAWREGGAGPACLQAMQKYCPSPGRSGSGTVFSASTFSATPGASCRAQMSSHRPLLTVCLRPDWRWSLFAWRRPPPPTLRPPLPPFLPIRVCEAARLPGWKATRACRRTREREEGASTSELEATKEKNPARVVTLGRRGVSPQRVYSSVCASECRAVVWGVQCGVH